MSEPAPPGVAEGPAGRGAALSPEALAAALGELHHWLSGLPAPPDGAPPALPTGGLDLATLLRELTALRHEVNLQTRAARATLEQNAEAVRQAQELLDALEGERADAERRRQVELDERLRPLLKTLTELYDALAL